MLEIIGIFAVLGCCLYQRYDLAAFAMGVVVYTKLWHMTIQLIKIFNHQKEEK